jgi:hypothetical protein
LQFFQSHRSDVTGKLDITQRTFIIGTKGYAKLKMGTPSEIRAGERLNDFIFLSLRMRVKSLWLSP